MFIETLKETLKQFFIDFFTNPKNIIDPKVKFQFDNMSNKEKINNDPKNRVKYNQK